MPHTPHICNKLVLGARPWGHGRGQIQVPAPGSSHAAGDTDNTQVNTDNENTGGEKSHEKLTREAEEKEKRRSQND